MELTLVVYDDNLEPASKTVYDKYSIDRLLSHIATCERYGMTYTLYNWRVAAGFDIPFVFKTR